MSRVLLIGRGPLPGPDEPQLGFSQLRTAAFLHALRASGHSVRLALLVQNDQPFEKPSAWAGVIPIQEEGPGWLEQLNTLRAGADVIAGAGPYNPSRAACLIADEEPVWADIPGDPFSELQALALAMPEALDQARIAAAQAGAMTVLGRADAISVISTPQRFATLGQLGMVGRLLGTDITPSIHVLPITNNFELPGAEPRAVDEGHPTVLALAGAFNPWFDDITLVKALDVALKKRPDLQVICTGGGIEGFYESGFNRFNTWAKDWADRVTIHGWLPHGELSSVLHTAHAGLSLDVTGSEPELGSRTRLLLFAQMGITPVSTVNCELAQRMQQAQALVPLSVGDVDGIAETLCGLRIDTELSSRAQSFCAEQFDVERVMAPLCRWVSSPHRTQSAMVPEATIAAELASHRDQLAQIYASPTWQVLDRVRALSSAATNRFRAR